MVIDATKNLMYYNRLLNHLDDALKAVAALESYEIGRYTFEGGYFMVQKGETKPMEEGSYEAHRKYVDVQMIVEGSEEIAWMELADTEIVGYDEEKDKVSCNGDTCHIMKVSSGMSWIAFPQDAHKAIRHTSERSNYTKIVIKLPVA